MPDIVTQRFEYRQSRIACTQAVTQFLVPGNPNRVWLFISTDNRTVFNISPKNFTLIEDSLWQPGNNEYFVKMTCVLDAIMPQLEWYARAETANFFMVGEVIAIQ